jgi:hypothetical protein
MMFAMSDNQDAPTATSSVSKEELERQKLGGEAIRSPADGT